MSTLLISCSLGFTKRPPEKEENKMGKAKETE
jgi:hypothetical protein